MEQAIVKVLNSLIKTKYPFINRFKLVEGTSVSDYMNHQSIIIFTRTRLSNEEMIDIGEEVKSVLVKVFKTFYPQDKNIKNFGLFITPYVLIKGEESLYKIDYGEAIKINRSYKEI